MDCSQKHLKKAKRVSYRIRKNIAIRVDTFIKLGLYKSPILPILLYGLDFLLLAKSDLQNTSKKSRLRDNGAV